MSRFGRAFAAALGFLFASAAASQTTPAAVPVTVAPIKPVKVVLVGDSTTAVIGGWGPSFCAKHVTSTVACLNLARGGRSSGSYFAEGSWDVAMSELKAQGYVRRYVLIQFGHNDQPGKPGRSTDLATEFPANLRRYVQEARAVGAAPVLLTPLTRRQFTEGKLTNDLEPWATAVRRVARELDVPLVDLNAESVAAVQAMGAAAATRFAQVPPSPEVLAAAQRGTTIPASSGVAAPAGAAAQAQDNAAVEPQGQAKLAFDYTHVGAEGADYFAAMVTRLLAAAVPDLRRNLVK